MAGSRKEDINKGRFSKDNPPMEKEHWYIYKITNLVNAKIYVGQHKYKKLNDSYMGSGVVLAKAKKKYGIENFSKDIIMSDIESQEQADYWERFYIALYSPDYNRTLGGRGFVEIDIESELERRRKIGDYWRGKPSRMKGKHHSVESKKKTSDAMKAYYEANGGSPLKGRKRSAESIEKCRQKLKGRPHSALHNKHVSEALKGRTGHKQTSETRKKIGQAFSSRKWFTNGLENRRIKDCDSVPAGWFPGRSKKV